MNANLEKLDALIGEMRAAADHDLADALRWVKIAAVNDCLPSLNRDAEACLARVVAKATRRRDGGLPAGRIRV